MFPEQIVVVPEIDAVGIAITVTNAVPDSIWLQFGIPPEAILTNEYELFDDRFDVFREAFPEAFKVIVWFVPPFIV